MSHILHITKGETICIQNQQLKITNKEGEITLLGLNDLEAIIVDSPQCTISAYAQVVLSEQGLPIIFCDGKFKPTAFSCNLFGHYTITKRLKEQMGFPEERKKEAFNQITRVKICHQKELLKHFNKDKVSISRLQAYEDKTLELDDGSEFQEAIAARVYFQELFGSGFKRFGEDGINSALNYGYTVLRAYISTMIVAKGFHPSLGLCHNSQLNNYNFSDDIIEVYRPLVDYVAYQLNPKEASLSKENRQKLLLVLNQDIIFKGNKTSFKQSVLQYLDSLRAFLLEEKEELEIPRLEVSLYEY